MLLSNLNILRCFIVAWLWKLNLWIKIWVFVGCHDAGIKSSHCQITVSKLPDFWAKWGILSPPTPSPVNWSLLHLNKLGIMKRCFHSAIIINHDSGLPCIQGPAWLHRCSAKTRMMSWGQTHQWQCLPSHNLIFLIDRKTEKYKLYLLSGY